MALRQRHSAASPNTSPVAGPDGLAQDPARLSQRRRR